MKEETIDKIIEGKDTANIINRFIKKTNQLYDDLINITPDSEEHVKLFEKLINRDIIDSTALGTWLTLLKHVSEDNKLKNVYAKCENILNEYEKTLTNRKDIFKKMSDFLLSDYDTDDEFTITMKRVVRGYKRKGILLENEKTEKLILLKKQLNILENKILDEMYSVKKVASAKLSNLTGIPKEIIDTLVKTDENKVGIPLDSHIVTKVLTYLDNEQLREKIEFHYNNKIVKEIVNFARIIIARHFISKILGYHNFSHYQMERNMFKMAIDTRKELINLIKKSELRFDQEIESLLKIKRKHVGEKNFDNKLNSWDIPFYLRLWKEEYGINESNVQNYFEIQRSLKGIMDLAQKFFNVYLIPIKRINWSDMVISFKVVDADNKEEIGIIFLDLLHRKNKTNISTAFLMQPPENGKMGYTAVVKDWIPTIKDNSMLITYNDVVSFGYHLAHCIGFLLNKPKDAFSGISGSEEESTNLIPLIFQYFLWEPSSIIHISSHFKTGKKMDNLLVNKLKKTKQIDIGLQLRNKVLSAVYDQLIHSDEQFIELIKNSLEIDDYDKRFMTVRENFINIYKDLHDEIFKGKEKEIIFNEGCFQPYNWIEIFQGREGKVYTDLISEIIAADIYSSYFKKNLLNKQRNMEFRKNVIEKIGKKKLELIIEDVLGRNFNSDGLINLYNIQQDSEASYFLQSELTNNVYDDDSNYFTEIETESEPISHKEDINLIKHRLLNDKNINSIFGTSK